MWLFAQHQICRYRADILLVVVPDYGCPIKLVVECDGREFHTSAQQVARDRRRDFAIRREGYRVLRFSGSEIHRRPLLVVDQIVLAFGEFGPLLRREKFDRRQYRAEITLRDDGADPDGLGLS